MTKAGYIRKKLSQIDVMIFEGMTHSEIIKEFEKDGFSFSLSGFRLALFRARKRNKSMATKSSNIETDQTKEDTRKEKPIEKLKPKAPFVLKEVPDDDKY